MADTESRKTAKTPLVTSDLTPVPVGSQETENTLGNKVATVAVVGLGVALIEAELIPGMLLGVAAMLVPDLFPKLGRALRPLVKGTIRAGYAMADRAREAVAEAGEHVEDIVAEVRAEHASESVTHPEPAKGHA